MNHRIARWAVYFLCLLLDVSVAASLYRGYHMKKYMRRIITAKQEQRCIRGHL